MRTRIQHATIINEGKRFTGTVTIEDDKIMAVIPDSDGLHCQPEAERVVEAEGMFLIPGVIDDHVHFRNRD